MFLQLWSENASTSSFWPVLALFAEVPIRPEKTLSSWRLLLKDQGNFPYMTASHRLYKQPLRAASVSTLQRWSVGDIGTLKATQKIPGPIFSPGHTHWWLRTRDTLALTQIYNCIYLPLPGGYTAMSEISIVCFTRSNRIYNLIAFMWKQRPWLSD